MDREFRESSIPSSVPAQDAMRRRLQKQLFFIMMMAGTCIGWTCGPTNPPEIPNCAAVSTYCLDDLSEAPVGELP
jgi:hypothetical protein